MGIVGVLHYRGKGVIFRVQISVFDANCKKQLTNHYLDTVIFYDTSPFGYRYYLCNRNPIFTFLP